MKRLKSNEISGEKSVTSCVGGMRFGLFNATIPLVRLDFFASKLRLSASSRILRRLIPILEANYTDIKEFRSFPTG